jgi:GNAT superfamily N-acetyltransferase
MITREATAEDWIELELFFKRIYRERHPLHNKDFWEWQYGNQEFGRSFICLNYGGKVVGHVGANFGGGLAWIINVYLDEECRGKGILTELYQLARSYYPLAATAANEAGLGLYKNMRWIRYYDLVRYVKINPNALDKDFSDICKHVNVHIDSLILKDTHYFRQPSVKGILMDDGTRAISQESVGGLRVVEIVNLQKMEEQAWQLGYLWMDYVSSWNDLETKNLEKNGWVPDYKSIVPWRLNPIQENYFCDITFLSEEPLNKEFVVHRSFSDHGRIGSIK